MWQVTGKFKNKNVKKYRSKFDHLPSTQEIVDDMIRHRQYDDMGYAPFYGAVITITEVLEVEEVDSDTHDYNEIVPIIPTRLPQPEDYEEKPVIERGTPEWEDLPF